MKGEKVEFDLVPSEEIMKLPVDGEDGEGVLFTIGTGPPVNEPQDIPIPVLDSIGPGVPAGPEKGPKSGKLSGTGRILLYAAQRPQKIHPCFSVRIRFSPSEGASRPLHALVGSSGRKKSSHPLDGGISRNGLPGKERGKMNVAHRAGARREAIEGHVRALDPV